MQCTPPSGHVSDEHLLSKLFSCLALILHLLLGHTNEGFRYLTMSTQPPLHVEDVELSSTFLPQVSHEAAISHDASAMEADCHSAPRSGDEDLHTSTSPGPSKESTEHQQRQATMQIQESELPAPGPALLRPLPVSLPSLTALEAGRKSASTTALNSGHPAGRSTSLKDKRGRPRSLNAASNPVHDDLGYHGRRRLSDSRKRSGHFPDSISDDGTYCRKSHVSDDDSSIPQLHTAWARTDIPDQYRHLATGVLYWNGGKMPEKPGPSSDDILEGWEPELASEDEETWNYVHRATGTVIETPPKDLTDAIIKEFDLAASYGDVPEYCQGLFEDGRIMYKITNPSKRCPSEWRTIKHPKIIVDDMKAYLANFTADFDTPAEVTLLTGDGQELHVDLETSDLDKLSGILLVKNIDQPLISRLHDLDPQNDVLTFFIVCHFLLRTFHDDEATKELSREVQGWFWMSERGESDGYFWTGDHYDVIHDDERCRLHFGYVQYLSSRLTLPNDAALLRLSTFNLSPYLGEYATAPA